MSDTGIFISGMAVGILLTVVVVCAAFMFSITAAVFRELKDGP